MTCKHGETSCVCTQCDLETIKAASPNESLFMTGPRTLKVLSVFNGEIPFITFSVEGQDVGKLWGTGGILSFEGDCEESAKIFFEQVIKLNRSMMEDIEVNDDHPK